MIQRIQSVYFLLSGVFALIGLFFPFCQYTNPDGELLMTLNGFALTDCVQDKYLQTPWGVLLTAILSFVLSFVCLFTFKNRKKQMRWASWGMISSIVCLGTAFVYMFSYADSFGVLAVPQYAPVFIVFALLFFWMGRRAVKKDDDLVRAADRIR